ncbi:MAG: carboxypeptidase regulatory-like domain-containing protein [Planctomycetota bacterium]|nr:MAG: carboxypeptidase regulatory-like domain-containing protein [Planctomycetota bacterium]
MENPPVSIPEVGQAVRPALAVCLLAAACFAAGCDSQQPNYAQLGLVEIGGTVTLDGQPVEGASVFFYDAEERYSYGITDASGHYTMMFDSQKSGVTPGEKRVEISTARNPLGDLASAEDSAEEEDPDAQPSAVSQERIPECYNRNSQLRVTITESDSAVDFNLKSDCSTRGAE